MKPVLLFLLTLGLAAPALAQKEPTGSPNHLMGGHYYLPSLTAKQPFITSQLTSGLGVLYGEYPGTILGQTRDIKIAGVKPVFHYQGALNNWIALSAGITGNALVGLDGASVVSFGASTAYEGRFGALVRLLRTESMTLALGFTYIRAESISASPAVTIRRAVKSALNGDDLPFGDETVRSIYQPDLRFAWTFSPFMGMTASLAAASAAKSVNDVGSNSTRVSAGLGLDFNFKPVIRIPIGAKLNFERIEARGDDDARADVFSAGLYETYSERFNFGAEFGKATGSSDTNATRVMIVSRYVY